MEYYSTLKRKKILAHAMTCVHLKDIMLNEVAKHMKTLYDSTYVKSLKECNSWRQKVERAAVPRG
jgi:hypothetical protein